MKINGKSDIEKLIDTQKLEMLGVECCVLILAESDQWCEESVVVWEGEEEEGRNAAFKNWGFRFWLLNWDPLLCDSESGSLICSHEMKETSTTDKCQACYNGHSSCVCVFFETVFFYLFDV